MDPPNCTRAAFGSRAICQPKFTVGGRALCEACATFSAPEGLVEPVAAAPLAPFACEIRELAETGLCEDVFRATDATGPPDAALGEAYDAFDELELARVVGFLGVRVTVESDGSVAAVDALCDTLVADPAEQRPLDGEGDVPDDVSARELLAAALGEAKFPPAATPTTITLPLAFD